MASARGNGYVTSEAGEIPDDRLLDAIAQGDRAAFEQLMSRHLDPVYGYLLRLTGSGSEAEDLAQETFLRVWRKAGSYQPGRVRATTMIKKFT